LDHSVKSKDSLIDNAYKICEPSPRVYYHVISVLFQPIPASMYGYRGRFRQFSNSKKEEAPQGDASPQ
jgi:hypothetical protein